jgi:serine/threonine-protein kinase
LISQSIFTGVRPIPLPIGFLHPETAGEPATAASKAMQELDSDALNHIAVARATTPAGLLGAVRGDLEAILAKALRQDPKTRFQSAREMRDEFERHLLGYPIETRPAGRLTRARKLVLRNKVAASVGLLFLLVVLFSIAGVVRQATEAARKRQIAQTRLHDLVHLTDVLAGELYESVHGLQGSEAAQAALLNSAHETINKLAADDDQDTQLDLELAREYEKLARLELSRTPLTSEALQQTAEDLDRERDILQVMNRRDPEAMQLRARLPELIRQRDAAAQRLIH